MSASVDAQANGGDGGRESTPTTAWRRWVIGALLFGAALSLVIRLAPDSYRIFGPYLLVDGGLVLDAVDAVLPFALAAAAFYGADGWPAGRSRLLWGASLLAVAALLGVVAELVNLGVMTDAIRTFDQIDTWMPIRYVAESVATVAGFGLLAAGLWGGRHSFGREVRPTGGRLAVAIVGTLAVVAVAADLWAALPIGQTFPSEYVLLGVVGGLLMAMTSVALAALAIVALRITPARAGQPELLIATGATMTMVGQAAQWALPYALLSGTESVPVTGAIFTVLKVATALGLAAISIGFVLAGMAVRPRAAMPEAAG